jgi:hypothetical protein
MKMANQGSARLCCENITGLKFGDLYRQKNSKIKDIQNNSEFSALFYDSKNYYKFGSKESRINNRHKLLLTGTRYSRHLKDYTTSIAPGIPIKILRR